MFKNYIKWSTYILLIGLTLSCNRQISSTSNSTLISEQVSVNEALNFQKKLNKKYLDPATSPVSERQREILSQNGGHNFFNIDPSLCIEASFKRIEGEINIGFETSSDRIAMYDKFGIASFKIGDQSFQLSIYQSHLSRRMPQYRDHLFLPYYDNTNGYETYGGGRYIDLKIPKGDTIIIDFNQSYYPLCAYSDGYSCPVPPSENFMDYDITAGVRNFEKLQKQKE